MLLFQLHACCSSVSSVLVVSLVKQDFIQHSPGHLGVSLQTLPNEHSNVLNCAVKGMGGGGGREWGERDEE